ncbi:hypothetical protein ACFQ3N_10640 [Virgibacillus byunsanensis]|uniref:Acyl-CoA dehydrogenase/oxidase C-terminal domain-containing protein n=1 Tax=Virgibacillus byunsanensis TaxID=570945 RepID=A0ABW3LKC9_9BACI
MRDAQVLTVWEGTANLLGLEVLRLLEKFEVHPLFLNKMKDRLTIMSETTKELAAPIYDAMEKLAESLELLSQMMKKFV